MIKLIIFDLDGTLLNTIEDLANSVNYALEQHHYPTHPVEAFHFFVGNGVNKMLERALPESERNSDNISMVKVDFIHHYFAHSEEFTKPYAGIPELLKKLSSEGFKLGVASNKVHQATEELIKRFFPEIEFSAVLGQRDGYPIKPDGGILNEIISIADVLKDDVMYVGDSGVDVATAFNAKVQFTGVLWGFRPQEELSQLGASRFARTPEELYQIIHS